MKECTKCGVEKGLGDFHKSSCTKDGLYIWCKACRKSHYLKKRKREILRASEWQKNHKKHRSIYMREYNECHREEHKERSRKERLNSPEKVKARRVTNHAIRDGKLERPVICPSCNNGTFVEAHHEDYDKPLDVEWLCMDCHKKLHSILV